ncbi:hypothetical protein [Parvularcula dongshanensis]|uniref:Uncharacterized protein n=1 Tax=Parvularcula dongshanensis TaxID=1173995 RepID=A0A840I2B5_9PROT|nr:hypothetical protein [Parvularcula dongshanensis]MBB4658475.1 hypothetical protein [Parvularcula dongshanensis]
MKPITATLTIYAAILTCAFALLLSRTEAQNGTERIAHLVVERLDVVEPDGTPRLILYAKARDPQIIVRGQAYRHPSRTQSGMLFYNDEGTEVGGLVVAGRTREDGTTETGGSLTFDAYEQDQIVQLIGYEEDGSGVAGLFVTDRPAEAMDFEGFDALARAETDEAREAVLARLAKEEQGASRAFFGRDRDDEAAVALRDAQGRTRLRLSVTPEGEAAIAFLNEDGEVVRRVTGAE